MKYTILLPILLIGLSFQSNSIPTLRKNFLSEYQQRLIANAGEDQTIYLSEQSEVTLSGGSNEQNTTFLWREVSTDFMSDGNIISANSPVTRVTNLKQGTFYFELEVSDGLGAVDRDTVVIRVNFYPPPSDAQLQNHMIFTDMAPVINLRDDTISYFPVVDRLHSRAGFIPNRYLLQRDRLNGMMIDSLKGKLYSTIEDGYHATGDNFARSAMSVLNDTDRLPLDTNYTYIYEWKGYFPQSMSAAKGLVSVFFEVHADDATSGPVGFHIDGESVYFTDNMQEPGNGDNATPAFERKYFLIPIYPVSEFVNKSHTVRMIIREGRGYIGQDAFVKVEIDGVQKYFRNNGQVGRTFQRDYPKVANLYDPLMALVDPNQPGRGRKYSLVTEDFRVYREIEETKITAGAGPNQVISLPTNFVYLSGNASVSGGSVKNYLWTKSLGPDVYKIANPSTLTTNVTNLVEGEYLFELKVTGDNGSSATSTVKITVNPAPNISPTANAGQDKTITFPTNTVSLVGEGSDPDGIILNYLWSKVSGPGSYKIISPYSSKTDVAGLVEGVYVFELKVTDNNNSTAVSRVQVTVNPAPNLSPLANAGKDKTITLPTNIVSLEGSGSDADGKITRYSWSKISGPESFKIVNRYSPITDVAGLIGGIYVFALEVEDDRGAISTSKVQVTVKAAITSAEANRNVPPIAVAGNDTTILAPIDFVMLHGNGWDSDGKIVEYYWSQISGPTMSAISPRNEAMVTVSNLISGTFEFELRVTDNMGTSGKDTVKIMIVAGRTSTELNEIKIYPNSAIDIITLELNIPKANISANVVISDMNGRRVYSKQLISSVSHLKESININNLIKGTYVVSVLFDGIIQSSVKLLKI